jgi:hypothetical protein
VDEEAGAAAGAVATPCGAAGACAVGVSASACAKGESAAAWAPSPCPAGSSTIATSPGAGALDKASGAACKGSVSTLMPSSKPGKYWLPKNVVARARNITSGMLV